MKPFNFTTSNKLFTIGEEIYPVDFSSFETIDSDNSIMSRINAGKEENEIKNKMRNQALPLVVVSDPYLYTGRQWIDGVYEYYIDVKQKGSDKIYRIFNCDNTVQRSYYDYLEYINDAEECAVFGY